MVERRSHGGERPLKRCREKNITDRSVKARRRRRRRKWIYFTRRISICMIAAAAIVYCMISLKYRNTFLPNTRIGGITVSGLTIEEVQSEIRKGIERYELILEERDGAEERINGEAIGLHPVFDGTLENILRKQNSLLWGLRAIRGAEYASSYMVEYDKGSMDLAVAALECLKSETVVEPADAYVAFVSGSGLQIIKEEPGKAPVRERLSEEIGNAVSSLETRISLDERAVYKEPGVSETDPELLAQKEALKDCADVTVTYRFGSRSEVLDGSTILPWLSMAGEGSAVVDRSGVEAYVVNLAKKYNTAYCAKELKTSYGSTVTITKGHYGWLIDKEAETEVLLEIIRSGESQEREPVYAQKAASHDGPDYGDTYVEMNLTAQHLFYYKNGKLLIESDFVSGNEAKGWSTPAGAYELTYKQRNAVLKGKNYNTPVTYWMPFNGNIGMHDGYWRSSFGGTIYKKNGSHGCINLPPAVAKTIYENIEAHIPVLCYHLDGTETGKTTPGAGDTSKAGASSVSGGSSSSADSSVSEEGSMKTIPNSSQTESSTPAAENTTGENQTAAPENGNSSKDGENQTSASESGNGNAASQTAGPGNTSSNGENPSSPPGSESRNDQIPASSPISDASMPN